jgi:hypothetical protein
LSCLSLISVFLIAALRNLTAFSFILLRPELLIFDNFSASSACAASSGVGTSGVGTSETAWSSPSPTSFVVLPSASLEIAPATALTPLKNCGHSPIKVTFTNIL